MIFVRVSLKGMNYYDQKATSEWTNNNLAPKQSDLLIKSRRVRSGSRCANALTNESLADNKARTEALYGGIERKRVSAYGIEAYGTLMAHLPKHRYDDPGISLRGESEGYSPDLTSEQLDYLLATYLPT
jgi:hypothetical protein